MNLKRKLLAVVASSALVCSSAFAEGFYAKVGAAGAMSMKPSTVTAGDASIVPSAYVGFGMNVMPCLKVGVEAHGWLNDTKIADGLEAGDYVLKGTPFTGHLAVYYDVEVSDSIKPFVGARVGYAKGAFGINDPKPKKGKTMTDISKKAVEKSSELASLTAGASLGLGVMMTDSISIEVAYNLDYYKISPTQEAKDAAVKSKVEDLVKTTESSLFTHKASLGLSFKF
jgi:opacity protein-like surface antigen